MLFKAAPNPEISSFDSGVHEVKKRHADLLNTAFLAEQLVNQVVDDMNGTLRLHANGIDYAAFKHTAFAVGERGANVQWQQTGIKMVSENFTATIVINPDGIYYLETTKHGDIWQKTADVSIKRDDWRAAQHDERGIVLSALTYLSDELSAITGVNMQQSQPEIAIPQPRTTNENLAKVATRA